MMQQLMLSQGLQNPTAVYIGGATGVNSATLPAHAVGDLIVAWAYRNGSTTPPSVGAGFTDIIGQSGAFGGCSMRLAYRIATVTNTASGTWTNATSVAFVIYRNAAIGTKSGGVGANTNTVNYEGFAPSVPTGSSLVLGLAGIASADTSLETPPTGMVNRQTIAHASDEIAIHETSAGCYLWTNANVLVGGTLGESLSIMIEIKSA